jgi:hypothetical protein
VASCPARIAPLGTIGDTHKLLLALRFPHGIGLGGEPARSARTTAAASIRSMIMRRYFVIIGGGLVGVGAAGDKTNVNHAFHLSPYQTGIG